MPSLFPFILLTNIIILSGVSKYITKISKKYGNLLYAGIIGFICGYPMGAKATCSLYNENMITKKQAYFLMSFANNCNPIFILSTIGICVLDNISLGILLLFCHYASALIICIINFTHNDIIHENVQNLNSFSIIKDKKLHKSIFEIVDTSIKATFVTLGNILAFILIFNLFFSVFEIILLKLNISKNIIYSLSGLFEVTNGISQIYLNTELSFNTTLSIISFMLSFSGFSIIFQVYSCIYKIPIKLGHIIKWKIIQGILSSLFTYFILSIVNISKLNISMGYFNTASYFIIIVSFLFILTISLKK